MNLKIFNTANLFEAATNLFQQLNIKLNSNTAEPLPVKDLLKQHYKDNDTFKTIGKTYFIGIIDNTVFQATGMFDVNYSYKEALQQGDKNYDGLMLFALELSKQPTRTEISDLTRTFNRISQKMPVALVLKYKTGDQACFSIAISERFKYKQNWRQGEKAGKVIILRDIHTETTHPGHERILLDLVKPFGVTNYDQLHQHWLQVLDVNILNKKFFQDLANWYFWAMENVSFPDDLEKKKDVRNATNLIRLITRVVFIWFIKEKSLVPNALFNKAHLEKILKDFNKNKKSQNYYHAILQNLFFGTLNQKMDERKFAKEGDINTNRVEFGVKNLFRYADLFTISEKEATQLFKDVPFLNGGLFDCLDKPNEEGKIVYIDGFSRNPKKQASVPDYIFFGEEREVDLNDIYATKNKKYKSRGLISLLESYKFTVAENTPLEEEVALDPELLGKVFENLLASYNPETQTTARKQTGSFYTPREIVNYMVDESLLEYIKQNVKNDDVDFEPRLRELISYSETPNPFDEKETKALIEGINNCKILDPACGSGAYPMGILHKMVHLLQKLDPENKLWKALQRQKAMEETEAAFNIGDKEERGKRLAEINDVFENNASDYGRKLYLIENCIYGIDIQPIAVQISKLRFFISLVIDQNKQASKENFGIRSLPNLETKFVAANTLIGLDKPELKSGDMFLQETYEKIKVLSSELKGVRHKYFSANNRPEKQKLQGKDKLLRKKISEQLEKVGYTQSNAHKIADFDPYDQNHFANWFEIEWMFGNDVIDGFDIVIGNPPFVSYYARRSAKLDTATLRYYQKHYDFITETKLDGKFNTIMFFIEKACRLSNKKANVFYIMDVAFNDVPYRYIRKYLLDNTTVKKVITGLSDFENVYSDQVLLQFSNTKHIIEATKNVEYFKGINTSPLFIFDQNIWKSNRLFEFNPPNNNDIDNIYGKMEQFPKLGEIFPSKLIRTCMSLAGHEDEFLSKNNNSKKNKPILKYIQNAKNFPERYSQIINPETVVYDENLKDKLNQYYRQDAYNDVRRQPKALGLGSLHSYLSPKIFVRQSADKIIATYTEEPCAANTSFYVINNSTEEGVLIDVNLKYITGILNSRILSYYALSKNIIITGNKKQPQMMIKPFKMLPIPNANENIQKTIISLVDFILLLKREGEDSVFFERVIDAITYELYLPEEIKAGNAEVLKHLSNLPELKEGQDEKNLKTIEMVYKELSDPKHPISAALLKTANN
jgi:adenine-specific DNA-methyltransferase